MDQLAHLETFVAVAEMSSITRAAETLDLPQPLVSRRIQSLERAWGAKLFERESRGLVPTALGDLALPYARDLVHRARHLDEVLARARATAVHAVAIPPGCAPRALAALIAAADAEGITIALHEAGAAARRDELTAGRCSAALLRTAPTGGALHVPLGLARVPEFVRQSVSRPVHLDALRQRRGSPDERPRLLLTPEDDLEPFAAGLARAAARAGLSAGTITSVPTAGAGAAEVLAGRGSMLCDAQTAAGAGLEWAPLADETLHRGYELAAEPSGQTPFGRDAMAALRPALAGAIGAVKDGDGEPDARGAAGDGGDRLAARGA